MVLAIVREAAPVATALLIAGAGGSAMTADLGARKIRDELAAMEVMSVNPVHRLVTPRLWAASTVGLFLVSLVSVAGIAGGYFFNVVIQKVTPGAYFQGFTSLVQLPDLYSSLAEGVGVRVHRRHGRLLQGHLRQGRAEGRGRRGEPGRGDHLHPHLLRQLRHDVPLLRAGAAEVLMTAVTRVTRPSASTRPRAPATCSRTSASSSCFYAEVLWEVVTQIVFRLKYRNVVFNLVSDITIGAGALIVGGGMVFVIFSMSFFTGTEVGLQGFKGLEQIGAEAFTGLIGSFANTREVTPLIAGVAFAAQVGAGLHRRARRHAHLRGDRRPRGDVGAVEDLPGGHPGGGRAARDHPALPDLAVRQLLRHQGRHDPVLRAVAGRLRLLLPPLPARRSTWCTA